MGIFDNLQTMAEVNAVRRATPKHEIEHRVITREAKKKTKKQREDDFREGVWARDKGKCRATGATLVRGNTTDDKQLGEVDHAYLRSLAPELIFEVSNGLLIQKFLNRLRKVSCRLAPEHKYFDYTGPADRSLPQTFIWRDDEGRITKTRIG